MYSIHRKVEKGVAPEERRFLDPYAGYCENRCGAYDIILAQYCFGINQLGLITETTGRAEGTNPKGVSRTSEPGPAGPPRHRNTEYGIINDVLIYNRSVSRDRLIQSSIFGLLRLSVWVV